MVKLPIVPFCFMWLCLDHVGLLNFSISSFTHGMMIRLCVYRLGSTDCASGSLSDLVGVICRDHLWIVCPGSFRGRMCYSISCCSHYG
jgi:hypothetical protein